MSQPDTKAQSPKRLDIVLDFACWCHQTRRSWWRRLLFKQRLLDAAFLWDEGDSGGFVIDHKALLQAITTHTQIHWKQTSYDAASLPTFLPPSFTELKHIWLTEPNPTAHLKADETRKEQCVYEAVQYHWWPLFDREIVLLAHSDRKEIRQLIETRFAAGDYVPLSSFAVESLAAQIGLVNQRIADTALRAAVREKQFDQRIQSRDHVVRNQRTLGYVPLAYLNLRLGKRFGQYFASRHEGRVDRVLPKLPLCPWRVGFWGAAGLALLNLAMAAGQWFPQLTESGLALLPLLGLAPAAAVAFWRDRRVTETWLICDDGDGTAWQCCAEQAKQWAREGRAHVEDPYYVSLLEGPAIDVQRLSFRFNFTFRDSENKLELIYLSPSGLAAAGPALTALGRDARGLTWFSQKPAAELDGEISDALTRLGLANRRHELRLVRPTQLASEPLPMVEAILSARGSVLRQVAEAEALPSLGPEANPRSALSQQP